MTIQVAVMNGYGLAMASDRHVFRGADIRSTGQDVKLLRLRGSVPAAMMASGPFAVFGLPVSRLALRLERALAAAGEGSGPEQLAEAVLGALAQPLEGVASDSDAALLAEVAQHVARRARRGGMEAGAGLRALLDELDGAPRCRDAAAIEAAARAAWEAAAARLADSSDEVASLLTVPELSGRAVSSALARDWMHTNEVFLTIGLVCPRTGVPAIMSLRAWRGLGGRLNYVSRLKSDFEVAWRAGCTVVVAQGSGRPLVEAIIDGLADPHWEALSPPARDTLRPEIDARWDRAHDRLGVASPRELAAIATGLVRGAEVVGYLTRDSEGTVAPVDGLCLTARGVEDATLEAGPELRVAA